MSLTSSPLESPSHASKPNHLRTSHAKYPWRRRAGPGRRASSPLCRRCPRDWCCGARSGRAAGRTRRPSSAEKVKMILMKGQTDKYTLLHRWAPRYLHLFQLHRVLFGHLSEHGCLLLARVPDDEEGLRLGGRLELEGGVLLRVILLRGLLLAFLGSRWRQPRPLGALWDRAIRQESLDCEFQP